MHYKVHFKDKIVLCNCDDPTWSAFWYSEIPCDYDGVMGVPITIIDSYSPEQFEIVGNEYLLNIDKDRGYVNGKRMYSRIFIRKKVGA